MECITTLFYGNVASMNELELVAEIAVTIWGHLYLIENGAPKELKRQIKAYYAHIWSPSHGDRDFAGTEGVSSILQEEIVFASLRGFAAHIEAFRTLDANFPRALLVCLKYVVCSQGEDVVVLGDMDRSMYFIGEGQVLVRNGTVEIPLRNGQFFGELGLLFGIPRLATCIASTVTELYRLDYEPYERLLLDFPEYRARIKLAWSTFSMPEPDSSSLEAANWRIYRTSMALLAQLDEMDPLDTKEFIAKCRVWTSKPAKKQEVQSNTGRRGGISFPVSLQSG
ncbi:hypothetical protein PHYPSEUDO_010257 [Phytophthora pseudosyringae]|uniref:Cyclic nucleotide-binding domain-containing protein n=1 Tax=Phytophthora pseudosyringae TaxID=221518 RepID=A0A8T1VDG3_9STRA|nr:hypothetical protein PHYPSEUDO_010257 [Phytophthora pseudosyringae]